MKINLSPKTIQLTQQFDRELMELLREDVVFYHKANNNNLVNFNTKRFDLELQRLLQEDLENLRMKAQKTTKFANAG